MLEFIGSPRMTVGVEIELQLLDAVTRDLTAGAPLVLELLGAEEKHVKPEILRGMLEINTGVCTRISEVRADLERAMTRLREVCGPIGVSLASAGSHPFARHRERLVYPSTRFASVIDRHRWLARRLMIFGMHVHVGMRDGDHAMAMLNGCAHYLPHMLALSASSPFWQGSDTGLASSRITIFEAVPTAGHPCLFSNWAEFQVFYEAAVRSRAIKSTKDIWWDIRPQPEYGTVEVRVCDGLPTIGEAVSMAALIHCLFCWLDERHQDGELFSPPPYWVLRENKWRASRWGLDADIVTNEAGFNRPLRGELERLFRSLEPYAAKLECSAELHALASTMDVGLSYQRQRAVYDASQDLQMVAEMLIHELRTDKPFVC
ncbi:MAG: glutamate--cysteine ligase [Gemmatimonadetes bacterium]|nr:glutamate--cysteine ligase [Gemmatimonadota bacterium]